MSQDFKQELQWLDIDSLNERVYFDLRGMTAASLFVQTPNGLGSAVLEVRQSFDGGVTTGVPYFVAKAVTTTAPLVDVDVTGVPGWVVVVTTAGTSGEKASIRLFATVASA